jgi:signal transduction histidine kinase
VRERGQAVLSSDDARECLKGFVTDRTDQTRAEEELRLRNAMLATQSESTLDGVLAVGLDGQILTHNRRFAEMWGITANRQKRLQILINLLRNARLALRDSRADDRRLPVRTGRTGATRLSIAVMDNGVGIPPEDLTHILAHGFTTKKDGHGLGLHGSALAAEEMWGSLTAHSDSPGRGETFILELPVQMAETGDVCSAK